MNEANSERKIWIDHPSSVLNYPYYAIYIILFYFGLKLAWPTVIVPLAAWLWKYYGLKSTRYELTDQRLFVHTGMFSVKSQFIELYRIKDYLIEQPWYLRWFNLSHLTLKPVNSGDESIFLKAVPNPIEIRDEIRHYAESKRDKQRNIDFENWTPAP